MTRTRRSYSPPPAPAGLATMAPRSRAAAALARATQEFEAAASSAGDVFRPGPPAAPRKTRSAHGALSPPPRKRLAGPQSSAPADALPGIPVVHTHIACATPLIRAWVLPTGTTLYVGAEPIGTGSFGHVYPAIDAQGRSHAVKISRPDGKPSPTRRRVTRNLHELEREFALAKRFEPNANMQMFRVQDDICWTMPLRMGTVAQWRGGLTADQAQTAAPHVLATLLKQLQVLHAAGIAHGDLKPDNVLVGEEGQFYLADLGGADAFAAEGKPEVGDFNRQAPEQFARGALHDKSDMWALGIMIWEVAGACDNPLTGQQDAWQAWHAKLPRDVAQRVAVVHLPADDATPWNGMLRALPPTLADVLVNDLLHPAAAMRRTAVDLLTRLPMAWQEGSAESQQTLAQCAQVAKGLPAAGKRDALQAWYTDYSEPKSPRNQAIPFADSSFSTP